MDNTIFISPEELIRIADEMQAYLKEISAEIDAIYYKELKINEHRNENDSIINLLTDDRKKADEACKTMQVFIDSMRYTGTTYFECEKNLAEIIGNIYLTEVNCNE